MSDQMFLQAYRSPVPLELPSGETIQVQAPTVRQAADYIELLMRSAAGERRPVVQLIERFTALLSPEDAAKVDALALADFYETLNRFFGLHGTPQRAPNGTSATTASASPG